MTIDGLNALTTLTAGDELPVWDVEASAEEPTKKITAQNMAASVKSLASLPSTTEMNTAIQQSTATLQGVDIQLTSSSVNINPGTFQVFTSRSFTEFKFIDLYFEAQTGYFPAIRLYAGYVERKYKLGFFAWNDTDNALRRFVLTFTSNGRYMDNAVVKMAYGDSGAFNDSSNTLHLVKAIGYAW